MPDSYFFLLFCILCRLCKEDNPKNDCPCINLTYLLRIPKMNGFCLECHLILKKCWFEVGQSKFKHPVFNQKI